MTSEVDGDLKTVRGNSEVASFLFKDPKASRTVIIFEKIIISALGGYLVAVLVFIIFFPAGFLIVILAFLSGSLVSFGVIFLLRRIIGDNT